MAWFFISLFKKKELCCMITLQDFRTAPFEKKCDVVMADTNFIVARKFGDAKVYLYHTGEFYIEVYYSPKYKKVLMINAFDDTKGLEPYAEAVSLAELGL
ncbi:MAG: hypothetical protein ACK514_13250 [Bacteroidota bacterium]|nr:hypothetical protein [Cytophagales bacterium]MCE2957887.1 hypothetical protein [Flammeovirgaceae bacterium]MCZ8070934.1 hypothetical protein [Cytophagales bacterium]